jgi:hypothetical protein
MYRFPKRIAACIVKKINVWMDGVVRMMASSTPVRTIRSVAAAAAIIAACPARGEDALCGSVPELAATPSLTLGHISSAADRVHFVKDAAAQSGCPSRAPACAERAYLVPGDHVIISARRDAFVCATYINSQGGDRSGWLPADAVAGDSTVPVALADWSGNWSRAEARITVKAGKAGALQIKGEATFGARDPDRVKRGAVNTGEIEGDVTPAGDHLSFAIAVDDGAILPVDKGDELSCKVWMQRIGPWLIVNDNGNCGGHKVTFGGFYTRRP